MTFRTDLIQAITTLPSAEKELLHILAKHDRELFFTTLKKIMSLKAIIKTGNKAAWERFKQEEMRLFDSYIRELEDQIKILTLEKKLKE